MTAQIENWPEVVIIIATLIAIVLISKSNNSRK